jgi:mannose-6-phosphate isomerase-like protein (cupin superfamily)
MEGVLRPGAGPPPHVHRREDEGFLVIVGEVTFFLGDEKFGLKPGEYLFAPPGIPHPFKNRGSGPLLGRSVIQNGLRWFARP